jgi:hypothetical protein
MVDKIEVPKHLKSAFKRVSRRIPVDLKKDEVLLNTLVAYLQLGGEKLARQVVVTAKQTIELENAQKRKKAREEALIRAAEARLAAANAESAENDDDFDDDDDDDTEDDDVKAY